MMPQHGKIPTAATPPLADNEKDVDTLVDTITTLREEYIGSIVTIQDRKGKIETKMKKEAIADAFQVLKKLMDDGNSYAPEAYAILAHRGYLEDYSPNLIPKNITTWRSYDDQRKRYIAKLVNTAAENPDASEELLEIWADNLKENANSNKKWKNAANAFFRLAKKQLPNGNYQAIIEAFACIENMGQSARVRMCEGLLIENLPPKDIGADDADHHIAMMAHLYLAYYQVNGVRGHYTHNKDENQHIVIQYTKTRPGLYCDLYVETFLPWIGQAEDLSPEQLKTAIIRFTNIYDGLTNDKNRKAVDKSIREFKKDLSPGSDHQEAAGVLATTHEHYLFTGITFANKNEHRSAINEFKKALELKADVNQHIASIKLIIDDDPILISLLNQANNELNGAPPAYDNSLVEGKDVGDNSEGALIEMNDHEQPHSTASGDYLDTHSHQTNVSSDAPPAVAATPAAVDENRVERVIERLAAPLPKAEPTVDPANEGYNHASRYNYFSQSNTLDSLSSATASHETGEQQAPPEQEATIGIELDELRLPAHGAPTLTPSTATAL